MMGWIRKHPIFSVIFLVLAGWAGNLVYTGYFNMKGYCWEEARYLSEDELIHGILDTGFLNYSNHRAIRKRDIERKIGSKIQTLVDYRSVEQFRELNADCCLIYKNGRTYLNHNTGIHDVPKTWKYLDRAWVRIAVNFRVYYLDMNVHKGFTSMQGGGWVNSCGKNIPVPLEHFVG